MDEVCLLPAGEKGAHSGRYQRGCVCWAPPSCTARALWLRNRKSQQEDGSLSRSFVHARRDEEGLDSTARRTCRRCLTASYAA